MDDRAHDRLRRAIANPPSGATLLYRGEVPAPFQEETGNRYIAPAIFAVDDRDHPFMQVEYFGPVLAIARAKTFDEALDVAISTEYALTGAVFSRNPSHLDVARRRFRVGNLYLNRGSTGALVGRQPFGGFGMSGIGTKAGGPGYLLHYTDPRVVTENTVRRGFTPDVSV